MADGSHTRNADESSRLARQMERRRQVNAMHQINEFDPSRKRPYLANVGRTLNHFAKAAGLIVMYLKCAHPDCSSDFDYGQGRLFRFQQAPRHEKQAAHWHAAKHYWLCKRCCQSYTIEYQTGLGVLLMQRLDAIAGGRPDYHVLQAELAPKPSLPRRFGRSRARQIRGTAGLPPVAVGAIEILETRNLERRGKPE